jgi:hypothetical protein
MRAALFGPTPRTSARSDASAGRQTRVEKSTVGSVRAIQVPDEGHETFVIKRLETYLHVSPALAFRRLCHDIYLSNGDLPPFARILEYDGVGIKRIRIVVTAHPRERRLRTPDTICLSIRTTLSRASRAGQTEPVPDQRPQRLWNRPDSGSSSESGCATSES